jgi:hypothetical protein
VQVVRHEAIGSYFDALCLAITQKLSTDDLDVALFCEEMAAIERAHRQENARAARVDRIQ